MDLIGNASKAERGRPCENLRSKVKGGIRAITRTGLAAALASSCMMAPAAAFADGYTGAVTIHDNGVANATGGSISLNIGALQNFEFSATSGNFTRNGGTVYANHFDGQGSCTLTWRNAGFDADGDRIDFSITIFGVSGAAYKPGSPNKIWNSWGTRADLASHCETDRGAWTSYRMDARKAGTADPATGRLIIGITDIDQEGEQIYLVSGYGKDVWTEPGYKSYISLVGLAQSNNTKWSAKDGDDNESYESGFVATFDPCGGTFKRFGGLAAEILNLKVMPDYPVAATADKGGSITPSGTVSVMKGGAMKFSAAAEEGYTFTGLVVDGGTPIDSESCKLENITSPRTVHAGFEPNPYRISFDANDGEGEMEAMDMLYDEPRALEANSFTKIGYTFAGWNTEADGAGEAYVDAQEVINLTSERDGEVTMHAQWVPNDYTVDFDPNGGFLSQAYIDDLAASEGEGGDAEDPAEEPGGGENDGDEEVADPLEIDAADDEVADDREEPADDEPSAPGEDDVIDRMKPQAMVYDLASALSECGYEKVGYAFAGWNTAPDGTGDAYEDAQEVANLTDEPDGEVTLYAQWEPIPYVIAFDANGGEGQMTDQELFYDEPETLALNGFERDGHEFSGWSTEANGTGEEFADGEEVLNLADEADSVVTLYAQWDEVPEPPVIEGTTYDKTGVRAARNAGAALAVVGCTAIALAAAAARRRFSL